MSSTRLSELEELVWRDMLYQFPYLYTTIRASIDDFGSDAVKRHINLFWKDKLT
jgi:hypothetical protein